MNKRRWIIVGLSVLIIALCVALALTSCTNVEPGGENCGIGDTNCL